MRSACVVAGDDDQVAIRAKVTDRLTELASHLPEDLRVAALAAFGISAEARQPLYQDRIRWAAQHLDRDPRTVRRRVDEAIEVLAELASAPSPSPAEGDRWHTAALAVTMVLDQPEPEVFEQRRVVADEDGVRSLDLAISFPAGRGDLSVTVFYGGTVVDRGMATDDRWGYGLELPHPLSRGEQWEFGIRFRLPPASMVRPHLVCVPRHPCEALDLRVRFGLERPSDVRVLEGAFQRDVTTPTFRGRRHPVDSAGDVHLRFRHLTPGLAYGARWDGRSADLQ
ncbi:hypothetical protein GTY80_16700 [Amycolatopsis sp. SID8362]|nr:hypothetical protein [Amycolatopsis sp. SID8362]NED41579.1 hypothetical protein [Amycolatopsis sp. SID8362]